MKRIQLTAALLSLVVVHGLAQSNPVIDAFPKGTVLHSNIPYSNDDLPKHLLDVLFATERKRKITIGDFLYTVVVGW